MLKYSNLCECIRSNSSVENKGITFIKGENDEKFVSYRQLYDKSLKYLGYLQKEGIQQGEELILQIEDCESFLYVFWGCLLGGIIAVPVTVGSNEKLFNIWKSLNAPHIIANMKALESLGKYASANGLDTEIASMSGNSIILEQINREFNPSEIPSIEASDIAFIQFSSGSTGQPKGVVLTHDNLIVNTHAINKGFETTEDDSALSWMPLTHDMGIIAVHLSSSIIGINQYIMPTSLFVRKPVLWFKKMVEHKATQTYSPNFGYKHFLTFFDHSVSEYWDLSHVRMVANGAEPISSQLCDSFLDELSRYGLKRIAMKTVYGLAEATVGVSIPPMDKEFSVYALNRESLGVGDAIEEIEATDNRCLTFVDVGQPIMECFVRICNEEDIVLGDNRVGYIQIKGKNVTSGYYNNEEATLKVITEDGWLNTGDLGFMRQGRLVITGRAKDIIFVNGQNFYPHDIERVAESVPGVELGKIAACSVSDKEQQKEEIIAFVLFRKSHEEFIPIHQEIKRHIKKQMGLDIKSVVPIKKMPKTTSGKIQRYKLGDEYKSGKFDSILKELKNIMDTRTVEVKEVNFKTPIEKRISEVWCEVLGVESVGRNDNFFEIGGNSLLLGKVFSALEKEYPSIIKVTDTFDMPTVSSFAEYIGKMLSGQEKILPLSPIVLSNEYFHNYGGVNDNRLFKKCEIDFKISGEVFSKLKTFMNEQNLEIYDFALLVYMILFSKVSGNGEVTIHTTLGKDDHAYSLCLDLQKTPNLSDLISSYKEEKSNPKCDKKYDLDNMKNIRINKSESSILVFVYNSKWLNTNILLNNFYDFVIEIREEMTTVNFTCEFNEQFLRKEKVEELIKKYIGLLKILVNNFN